MKRAAITVILSILALTGCSSSSSNSDSLIVTHVTAVNLVTDAPIIRHLAGDNMFAALGYSLSRPIIPITAGDYEVTFTAQIPPDIGELPTTIDLGTPFVHSFSRDQQEVVVTFGSVAQVQALVVDRTDLFDEVPEDTVRIQFMHAAGNTMTLDLEIDASNSGGSQMLMPGSLAPGGFLDPIDLVIPDEDEDGDGVTDDPGVLDLVIRLIDPMTSNTVYISPLINIREGANLFLAIAESYFGGVSPLKLVAFGIDGATSDFENENTETDNRLVNVSPDSGPMDMYDTADLMTPLIEDVSFRDISQYVRFPVGDVSFTVTPANDPATSLFEVMFSSLPALVSSVYAVNLAADISGFSLFDDRRIVATESRLRFIIAAPSLEGMGGVDIFVTDAGDPVDFDNTIPFFNSVFYLFVSTYFPLQEASYDVTFALNDGTLILGPVQLDLVVLETNTFVLIEDPIGTYDLMTVQDAP